MADLIEDTEPDIVERTEAELREIIESGETPTVRRAGLRMEGVVSAVPTIAELEAEQAEQEEFAGIFLEQQQTISSLDSLLREKAAEPSTTGTLYVQPSPPGTGTNFALFIGAGLGLWLLMK